jgi:hypothetical protein
MAVPNERVSKETPMRYSLLIVMVICLSATTSDAEMGFDEKYERDYNIFNPVNKYQTDNPLNPVNKYDPDNAFNPVNQYHPDNPLNPVNKYNSNVPFAPLDGGGNRR